MQCLNFVELFPIIYRIGQDFKDSNELPLLLRVSHSSEKGSLKNFGTSSIEIVRIRQEKIVPII